MKALEPDMIIRFPNKPDYVDGKVTVEVSRPRKFLCFKWMGKFKKEQLTINYLRYHGNNYSKN
jgi:hypothetical protein